ncbi:hypothetical protein [Spirosoma oryzicola]|uniref:hypothetical protein n=1 Tax=Spirosoma oryzicola TaxID=2898794 RepID=UPI001E49775D|nr:hypothetical protein [Spirosoma oryzicola]UHG94692.1 hypothetical protein LQ777_29280 [Spirosoma oryzicola]
MFSQYSWWDFVKFALVLIVPYYAFVLWKYYRQDIVEWFRSRGETPTASTQDQPQEEEEEEVEDRSLYTAVNYSSKQDTTSRQSEPLPSLSDDQPYGRTKTQSDSEVDIAEGIVVDQSTGFDLQLPVNVERPEEHSVDEVIETAKGLLAKEDGTVSAQDQANEKAAKLAAVINRQRSTLVDGIPFTR